MSDAQVMGLQFIGLLFLLGGIGAAIEHYVKRPRRNRRRKNVLPAPDPLCVVGNNWRAHTQQGHRF